MFETRELLVKAEQLDEHKEVISLKSQKEKMPLHIEPLRRSYQQGKQISQIVSYIWRWVEEESAEYKEEQKIAKQLKEYFTNPTQDIKYPMGNLKKLFAADARQPDTSLEAMLLANVFKPMDNKMVFPIFNEFELGEEYPELGYLFEIDVNSFQGNLADATVNDLQLLRWVLPYPPRPHIGEATVTLSELDNWINNTDGNQYIPPNPYIPSSSC